jgi:hypothetical protein
MEPLLIIILPGILGGVVLALLFIWVKGWPARADDDGRLEPPSTNMINMARIRVTGVGGLGMVAMSIVVAIFVPRIRLTMAIALVLGGALAAALIALRRRQGPLGSTSFPGAHSMLSLDASTPPRPADSETPLPRAPRLVVLPAKP